MVFGLDKFTNLLTDWTMYLAPVVTDVVPVPAQTIMYVVGVVEIAAGLAVALKPRFGSLLVAVWLLGIIVNLIVLGELLRRGPARLRTAGRGAGAEPALAKALDHASGLNGSARPRAGRNRRHFPTEAQADGGTTAIRASASARAAASVRGVGARNGQVHRGARLC